MPLSEAAQQRITKSSRALWENFVECYKEKYLSHHMLAHGDRFREVSEAMLEFFWFCAEMVIRRPELAEVDIVWEDLSAARKDLQNRAVSWLQCILLDGKSIRVVIILDHAHLVTEVPTPSLQLLRIKLILHEIGHLYHFDELFHPGTSEMAREALSVHEAEAWWFCYSLIGLWVATCACMKKEHVFGNEIPPIWQLLQMRNYY